MTRHWRHQNPQVFERVAKSLLALQDRLMRGRRHIGRHRQVGELDQLFAQPLGVRMLSGNFGFDLIVVNDPALFGVDQENPAGLQPTLRQDTLWGDIEYANFRRHNHQVVLGHVVARWAQAIAVQHGTDLDSVSKADGGGSVPGFHQAAVELVERLLLRAHTFVIGPRLWDHHHHGMREGTAAKDKKLETVVEHRRVAALGIDNRQHLRQVLAKQFRSELCLACTHPVDISAQCIDLTVVSDHAIGMRSLPAWECVCAEA